jgi:CheY-like chemotaxis protein
MAVVLIVEDEEQVRVLAEAIVQELGHETLTAGTAEQALAVIQERPDVDLLFTDIGLQQDLEAGLQLAKGIAARKPGLPVLYTTGQGVTDGMRAMFADPFGFLPKPYTPDDLTTALGNLLAIEPGLRAGASAARRRERRQLSLRLVSLSLRVGAAAPVGLRGGPLLRHRALALEHFGAMQPSLRHPAPSRLAGGVAGKFCHLLAVGGVSKEFVGRINGRQVHARALLTGRQACADPF